MGCSSCYKGTAYETATFDDQGRLYISPKQLREINVYPGEYVVLKLEKSKRRITLFSEEYFNAYSMKGNRATFKTFAVEPSGALRIGRKTIDEAEIYGNCFAKLKIVSNIDIDREEIRLFYGK